MNKNNTTAQFLKVITVLLGLNMMILGKAAAQTQTASLEIQPGNLSFAVPSSISFEKKILVPDAPLTENIFLNPLDNDQTIRVMDPVTGDAFHVNLTFKNMSTPEQPLIQEDPTQEVTITIPGIPVTINVKDADKYFVNDTIIVNQQYNNGNEHMRVVSVDSANNHITVLRGVDDTETFISAADPLPQGAGFIIRHMVSFDQFKVITLHGNDRFESVDTSTTNDPAGTNNGSRPISYYYHPNSSAPTDYPDANLTSFLADGAPGSDPTSVDAVSTPVTLMERIVDTPSYGIYSVGMLLRASIPAGNPSGNFSGELTFSLDP